MTGADLKAVVEGGKLLFPHDLSPGVPLWPIEDHFQDAVRAKPAN